MNDLAALSRLLEALTPWQAQVVLVGGWAHRMHRLHPLAIIPTYQPLLTRDMDIAFADRPPLKGDIKSALLEAGFVEEFFGEDHPPVTHYALGSSDGAFYAEFLTPLMGSGIKRNKEPDSTRSAAGITAQKLRHLEILLVEPWPIVVGPDQGYPLQSATIVQMANPVAFIGQKLLIQHARRPNKRAQDTLYIHDTLELFGAELPALSELWRTRIFPALSKNDARSIQESAHQNFSAVTDVIRDAAQIPADRKLSPNRVQQLCHAALAEIFA
ncbi:MAG: hypothetical protein IPP82_08490 [Xanthomonadales bacterium]|nr:hypothetical protein [Xanthomonadales bacterium]